MVGNLRMHNGRLLDGYADALRLAAHKTLRVAVTKLS